MDQLVSNGMGTSDLMPNVYGGNMLCSRLTELNNILEFHSNHSMLNDRTYIFNQLPANIYMP